MNPMSREPRWEEKPKWGPKINGPLLHKELNVNAQVFNYFNKRNYKPQKITIEGSNAVMLRRYLVKLLQKTVRNLTWDTRKGEKLDDKDSLLFGEFLKKLVKLRKLTFIEKIFSELTLHGYQQLAKFLIKLSWLNELTANLRPSDSPAKFFNQIMRSVKYLQKLERLNISLIRDDEANDEVFSSLARNVRRLSLTQLSFYFGDYLSFKDANINNLINMLPKLSKLASLNLDFHRNMVSPNLFRGIASILPQLKSLNRLSLNFKGYKYISDQGWQEFMHNLSYLNQLTAFELKLGNSLAWYHLDSIATLLGQLNHLTSLSLSLTAVSDQLNRADDARQKILRNISQLTQLELSLHHSNEIPDGIITTLANTLLSVSPRTKSLKLSFLDVKELSNDNLHELAQAIRQLPRLSSCTINLASCPKISESGIFALVEGISDLPRLTELTFQVYDCRITDQHLEQLGKLLRKLTNLTTLSIRFSGTAQVTKAGLDSLTNNLTNLPYLTELSIVLFGTDPAITQPAEAKFIQAAKKRYESGKLRVWIRDEFLN